MCIIKSSATLANWDTLLRSWGVFIVHGLSIILSGNNPNCLWTSALHHPSLKGQAECTGSCSCTELLCIQLDLLLNCSNVSYKQYFSYWNQILHLIQRGNALWYEMKNKTFTFFACIWNWSYSCIQFLGL